MGDGHAKVIELVQEGSWAAAHELVQQSSDKLSCLIHAYLHRVEGDASNAAYWYGRAGVKIPDDSPQIELERLIRLAQDE